MRTPKRAPGSYLALALLGAAFTAVPLDAQTMRAPPGERGMGLGFGSAVTLDGDEAYVGRTGETSGLPMNPTRPGGVHVFRLDRASGERDEVAHVTDKSVGIGDGFGTAVAVGDGSLIVGAPDQADGRGAVYVFQREKGDVWTLVGRLESAGGQPGDGFGRSLALSGDRLLVGATGQEGAGAVVEFRRGSGGSGWNQAGTLTPSAADGRGRFGRAIALDGDRLLVGTPDQGSGGAAYLFRYDSGSDEWTEEAMLVPGDEPATGFGISVSLVGDRALVAAPNTSQVRGAVFSFERDGGEWLPRGVVTASGSTPGMAFGASIAASAEELWVGAPGASGAMGAVFVFRLDEAAGTWSETQKIEGDAQLGQLGMTVARAGDIGFMAAPGADLFEGRVTALTRDSGTGDWEEAASLVDRIGGLEAIVGDQVDCEDGTAEVFGCADVDLVAFVPVSAIGPIEGESRGIMVNDVWGWTDPRTGREYALVGRVDATSFVDVTDPGNPVYLGELQRTPGSQIALWRDIKVYADHAFIVSDGAGEHGVQIFDLTQLRDVQDAPVTFAETAHYGRIHSAHNIVINEETGFAYVVGASMGGETCGGALHMIDIREPSNPTFAGCYADPATGNAGTGYTHDAQCVVYRGPDVEYQDREICLNASETALGIGDVTDKENPVPVASASYPSVGYAHQGWISEDHRYFFLNDELDEIAGSAPRTRTLVWDITDLDDPVLLQEYMGETEATDHNLYVHGRYMYQSNYVSGLRIIDVSDPENLVEVAYFDTVPWGEDTAGFAGSWSNYPYFESGNIIVTSMREGLFVLKQREPELIP